MSELLALAERCEKATGRDYEINKAIPAALGYVWNGALSNANPDGRWQKTAKGPFLKDDDFTGSIDAAMTLVPKFLFWRKSCGRLSPSEPLYAMQLFDSENNILLSEADAHTECGAIISAAFRLPAAIRARAAEVRG